MRRISVGGSLARAAMHAFIRAATEIAQDGKFDSFAGLISNPELNKFFAEDRKEARVYDAGTVHIPRWTWGPSRDTAPAQLPGSATLRGRFGSVSRSTRGVTARHCGRPSGTTMRYGLIWPEPARSRTIRTFFAWLIERAALKDRFTYTVLDTTGRAIGLATLMEIRPAMRVIEVGSIA